MVDKNRRSLTPDEALARAMTGELAGGNLARIELPKANLAGAKLARIDAAGANLRHANLRGADLAGADLSEADLRHADLTGADLTGADLRQVNAKEADFTGARLAGAKAIAGRFAKAVFHDAELCDADFSKAVFNKGRFARADLRRAKLANAEAADADFLDVDLTASDFHEAVFHECRFDRVKAVDAAGRAADFSLAEMTAVDFSRAGLAKAQFFNAALSDVNFTAADLADAAFNGSEHHGVNFQQANMKKTSLKAVRGCTEETLRQHRQQGAVIDLFLFRRFLRLLRRSLAMQIVAAALLVGVPFFAYRFAVDPFHWSHETLRRRAERRFQLGEYDQGIRLYQVAIKKYAADPSRVAAAKLAIARSYADRRQFDKAADLFQQIAASYQGNPEAVAALQSLAQLYVDTGQADRAQEIFDKIRQTTLDDPAAEANAEFGLAELLKQGERQDEALAKYLALFAKFRAEPAIGSRALMETVATLCDLDRLDEARETFERLKKYDPSAAGGWMRVNAETKIAQLLQRHGDFDSAEKTYRRIYETGGDAMPNRAPISRSGRAGFELIDLYQAQGRFQDAEAQIADMLARAPTEPARGELVLRRVQLAAAQGRPDQAIAMLVEELPKLKDKNKFYVGYLNLIELYAAKGDMPAAESTFNAAVGKFADEPAKINDVKLTMARLYASKGLTEKAQATYRDVIAHAALREQVASAKLALANELRRVGARDKAEPIYRELYEKGDVDLWQAFNAGLAIVDMLADKGQFAACEKTFADIEQRWRERPTEAADLQLRRIRLLQQEQRYDEARVRLTALLPELRDPNKIYDGEMLALGLAHAAGDRPAAEAAFRRLEARFGRDREKMSRAKLALAQCYADQGLADKAAVLYADMMKETLDPEAGLQTRLELARFCSNNGLADKAEALYRDIIKESRNPEAVLRAKLELANHFRRAGDGVKAEILCREIVDARGESAQSFPAFLALFDLLLDRRDFAEAAKTLDAARRRWAGNDPARTELDLRQARLFGRLGKFDDGVALLKKTLPSIADPDKVRDAELALIELYMAAGDAASAEELIDAALKNGAGNFEHAAELKIVLGEMHLGRNQAEKAEAAFRQVVSQFPDTDVAARAEKDLAQAAVLRGETCLGRNEVEKAEAAFREVLAQYPKADAAARAKFDLAGIYRRRGDVARAAKILRELAGLPNDNEIAIAACKMLADIDAAK